MKRADLLKLGLPVAGSVACQYMPEPPAAAVLGPSESELSGRAPHLIDAIQAAGNLLCHAVSQPQELAQAIDALHAWEHRAGAPVIVAMPWETVAWSCLRRITGVNLRNAGEAPLSAAAASIVVAEAILDHRERELRDRSQTPDLFAPPFNGVIVLAPGTIAAHEYDVLRDRFCETFAIGYLWQLTAGSRRVRVATLNTVEYVNLDAMPAFWHVRRFNAELTRRLQEEPDEVREMARMSWGHEPEGTEDDTFIDPFRLLASGRFDISWTDPEVQSQSLMIKPYPLCRLADICEKIDVADAETEPAERLQRSVWPDATIIHIEDDDLGNWKGTRILFRDQDDAEWFRALLEEVASERLLMPPWGPAALSPGRARELQVPWLDKIRRRELEEERKRELELYRKLADSGARLKEMAESAVEGLQRRSPVGAREHAGDVVPCLGDIEEAGSRLVRLHPWIGGTPAPIAILRRRVGEEREPVLMRDLLLKLAETSLCYDALVLLSTLAVVDSAYVAEVFKDALSKTRKSADHAPLAMGDWKALEYEARGSLRRLARDHPAKVPERLGQWVRRLLESEEGRIAAHAQQMTWIRNLPGHNDVHFFNPGEAPKRANELETLLGKWQNMVGYVYEAPLLFVEEYRPARAEARLRVRRLIGDGPRFDAFEMRVGRDTVLHNEEVYLLTGPLAFLPTFPFVHYHDGVVWLWHAIENKQPMFRAVGREKRPAAEFGSGIAEALTSLLRG